MAKEVKEIKEEEKEEVKTPAEVAEEKTEPKKERKKWGWKKKAAVIGGGLLAAALGIGAKLLSDRSYKRGVTDTTDYYNANPVEKTVYLPCPDAASYDTAEPEMTESATMNDSEI